MIKIVTFACSICAALSWAPINFKSSQPLLSNYHVSLTSSSSLFARRYSKPQVAENKPPMNQEIKYEEIRVVTPGPTAESKDEILGIMSKSEALIKAKELGGLDLILINPNGDPPVCKIVDYSKYRYIKEKKAKMLKKNSKASEVKEVKMSYKIDVHDYQVRVKAAKRFILQGNRVKLTVNFRGREVQHDALGYDLLNRLVEDMSEICVMDTKSKRVGMNLFCFISPRPEVMKAINQKKRNEEKAAKKKKEKSRGGTSMEDKKALVAGAAASVAASSTDESSDIEDGLDAKSLDELLKFDDDEEDDDDDEVALEAQGDALMNDLFG